MDAMDGFDNKTQQELQQFIENESSKAKLNGSTQLSTMKRRVWLLRHRLTVALQLSTT
jgi:hypothetical protein